ncbi:hypothetical protein F2Q68_00004034 [Brassica cretica]|uniref:Uncharacterized protein n=1 Tax=Brassica cretica TaxID=69181 RepID=A0A8S9J8V5_BRACR|nr:hypothetical protein F2Q68_00004034 [Brassica cretica]
MLLTITGKNSPPCSCSFSPSSHVRLSGFIDAHFSSGSSFHQILPLKVWIVFSSVYVLWAWKIVSGLKLGLWFFGGWLPFSLPQVVSLLPILHLEEVFYACDLRNFAGEELCSKPCAENLAVHSGMTSGLVELAVGIILELVPGPGISGSLSLFGVDSVIMLALEIFSLVVDIPVVARVFPSRGRLLRVVLLGEDFHLFFHHDEVCCLVKSVLDCSRFFKGYPLPEFRPVPESFPQSVDCHFVADSSDSCHYQLEPVHEFAEWFVFSLR